MTNDQKKHEQEKHIRQLKQWEARLAADLAEVKQQIEKAESKLAKCS